MLFGTHCIVGSGEQKSDRVVVAVVCRVMGLKPRASDKESTWVEALVCRIQLSKKHESSAVAMVRRL